MVVKDVALQARVLSALQHNRCWLCGESIHPDARNARRATVDHVIPLSKGGSNMIWNCAAAHYKCNNRRSDSPPSPEAWARLDALHLAMSNVGMWMREEDDPRLILRQQHCYRLTHGGPVSDIKLTRATLAALKGGVSRCRDTTDPRACMCANAAHTIESLRASLTRVEEERDARWQLMETRPADVDCFLAAVEVHNNATDADYWDIHLVSLDEETGEINEDTGWNLEDYTWWAPRPSPPTGIGDANRLSQSQTEATDNRDGGK